MVQYNIMKNTILLIMLFSLGCSVAENTTKSPDNICIYADKTEHELKMQGECFEMKEGMPVRFKKEHLERLAFDDRELEGFYINDLAGYVSRTGKFVFTPVIDNGPDYFREGLARYQENGKMGFVNEKLEVIIPAQFEFVSAFSEGKAAYCTECIKKQVGEHQITESDSWQHINKQGEKLNMNK